MATVHIRDVARLIGSRGPNGELQQFNICGYKYSRKDKVGGERFEYRGAVLLTKDTNPDALPPEKRKGAKARQAIRARQKNPHHFLNSTRNILLPTGEVRKVHLFLLTEFNGLEIVQ